MKKTAVLVTMLVYSLFASIEWHKSYEEALAEAKRTNRPVFVFMQRKEPPCRWCELMKNTTLKDSEIEKKIEENFIPLMLTREKRNYPKKLYSRYVPTIYVLSPDGKIVKKIVGYWDKKDFLSDLKDIDRVFKR